VCLRLLRVLMPLHARVPTFSYGRWLLVLTTPSYRGMHRRHEVWPGTRIRRHK